MYNCISIMENPLYNVYYFGMVVNLNVSLENPLQMLEGFLF